MMGARVSWNIVSYTGLVKFVLGWISPMVKAFWSSGISSSSCRNILLANSMPPLEVPRGSPILLGISVSWALVD